MDAHIWADPEGFGYIVRPQASDGKPWWQRLDGQVGEQSIVPVLAELLRLAARVKELEQAVAARDVLLSPLRWTREISDAWHRAIPDVYAAFNALYEMAGITADELVSGERRRQIELLEAIWKPSWPQETMECLAAKLAELRAEEGPRHLLIIGQHVKKAIGCMSNPSAEDIAHARREDPGCTFIEVSPSECPICTSES